MLKLDPATTALVLIDLQKGIVCKEIAPYTGEQIVRKSILLSEQFRSAGATIVLVNVGFAENFKDALSQPVDQPFTPPPGGLPKDFMELVDGLAKPGDILITKRQWGAFYGTEIDLQLRRRNIKTVVLGGVSTNVGVESTARQAWEHGYALITVEDITGGFSTEMHNFAFKNIFPKISKVLKTSDLAF